MDQRHRYSRKRTFAAARMSANEQYTERWILSFRGFIVRTSEISGIREGLVALRHLTKRRISAYGIQSISNSTTAT